MASDVLKNISDILDTYKGRDKVLKTLCYVSRLISMGTDDELSKQFQKFGSEASAARAMLRLMDDASIVSYAIEYGLGRKEPDNIMAVLGFLANVADLLYCPVDKISWAASAKLISVKNIEFYDTVNSFCWVLSTYFSWLRSIWYMRILYRQQRSVAESADTTEYSQLDKRRRYEILTCVRLSLDLLHAVNTLPPGFLWSSKLKAWLIALLGSVSGSISLYQMYTKK